MNNNSKHNSGSLLHRLRKLFGSPNPVAAIPPQATRETFVLKTMAFSSFRDFACYQQDRAPVFETQESYQMGLITGAANFTAPGYCFPCGREVSFMIDYLYSSEQDAAGNKIPNWRERLICPHCGLNNRIRASVQFLEETLGCKPESFIYMSEQTTPLYHFLHAKYANLTGSEYLGERVDFGAVDAASGLRNESITKLSFADSAFDFVLSFDVFEHIPEYHKALRECFRVLKPGGRLLFTVPFRMDTEANLVRATMDQKGNVTHLMEPEYHGDPISDAGCLCFYHFGWQLLDDLRNCGFASAAAHMYWSDKLGYLGQYQALFCAEKAA